MLAWLPAEQVDLEIGPAIARLTTSTITRLSTLHQELLRIRSRNGLAFERGECFSDVACVAAAIRSPEGPVASISLCGEVGVPLEKVAPLVAHAARKATETLFPVEKAPQRPQIVDETWSPEAMDALLAVGSGGDWI
jgi:DNA-binding IclR family transcriptional regulator